MKDFLKYGLIVLGVIVILLFLSKLPTYVANKGERINITQLQTLGDEAQRLLSLARQDQNPLLCVMHITTAMCKLHTLRLLGPPHRVSKKLDIDLVGLRAELVNLQKQKINEINATCPSLSLADSGSIDVDWLV
jgi:hypothetical protein